MRERTVLLRRSSLGDVVLLGAVTAAIEGHVTVVTSPQWIEVAARLRGVDAVAPWPSRPLGRVIDLQGSLRSLWLAPWARRIRKHSVLRRLRLWSTSGGRPPVPEIYAEACGVLPTAAPWIDTAGPREALALIPGAAWPLKRAPLERLVEIGTDWEGPVLVLGGPSEEALVNAVAGRIRGAEALCERGFSRTIDALGRTRVAVCGDTGLMHLAGACGAKVVAIFGPTHPDDGFFVYDGEVVQRDLRCRPCTLHRASRCRRGDHLCMELDAEQVRQAVARCGG
jgi:ADP-heptose:LPS heptosyltransferase